MTVGGSGTIGFADGPGPEATFHGVKSVSWSEKHKTLFASVRASASYNLRLRIPRLRKSVGTGLLQPSDPGADAAGDPTLHAC